MSAWHRYLVCSGCLSPAHEPLALQHTPGLPRHANDIDHVVALAPSSIFQCSIIVILVDMHEFVEWVKQSYRYMSLTLIPLTWQASGLKREVWAPFLISFCRPVPMPPEGSFITSWYMPVIVQPVPDIRNLKWSCHPQLLNLNVYRIKIIYGIWVLNAYLPHTEIPIYLLFFPSDIARTR